MLKRNKKEDKDVDLKPYTKNKRSKGLVIGMSLGVLVTVGSIVLYRSYAIYKEEKNYNIIQGIVPDFNYDVKVAITVDQDTDVEQVPERTDGKGGYYKVEVNCQNDGQPVDGEWDYNAWNLKIDDAKSGTKCDLQFTSNLPEKDYQEYIKEGIALRRNTYRGKELTANSDFYQSIEKGEFGDIFVGDYIKTNVDSQEITWLIADIDNYLNIGCYVSSGDQGRCNGSTKVTSHHVTIIPAKPLESHQISSEAKTTCGYAGTDLVKAVNRTDPDCKKSENQEEGYLETVYNKYINCQNCTFQNHVIKYSNEISDKMDPTRTNRFGVTSTTANNSANLMGASSNSGWYPRKLDLMNEVNVYGTTVASSSMFDTGMDHKQYALFRLKPELINSYDGEVFHYWLRDVASSTQFAFVDGNDADYDKIWTPNSSSGIRPRFLVGGTNQN